MYRDMSGAVQTVQQLAEMGIGLFAAVGAVTLFVALIGVMGSMLAAAHEKNRGDRHSAGARRTAA